MCDEDETLRDILEDMENCIRDYDRGQVPDIDWFDGGISMTKHWRMRLRAYLERKGAETHARG